MWHLCGFHEFFFKIIGFFFFKTICLLSNKKKKERISKNLRRNISCPSTSKSQVPTPNSQPNSQLVVLCHDKQSYEMMILCHEYNRSIPTWTSLQNRVLLQSFLWSYGSWDKPTKEIEEDKLLKFGAFDATHVNVIANLHHQQPTIRNSDAPEFPGNLLHPSRFFFPESTQQNHDLGACSGKVLNFYKFLQIPKLPNSINMRPVPPSSTIYRDQHHPHSRRPPSWSSWICWCLGLQPPRYTYWFN